MVKTLTACPESDLKALERVRFFPRQLLTVDDMETERDYFLQKLRRHNRFLHGFGVVCGLLVAADPIDTLPWRVRVDGGYALDPLGNEIYVGGPVFIDLAKCGPGAATDPCEPNRLRGAAAGTGPQIFLAISYDECFAKPVRAMPAGCGCDDAVCEYSRIRDSFRLQCLTELPDSHQPRPEPTLCDIVGGKGLSACPPCPLDGFVVLATITLPDSPTAQITDAAIDNVTVRRLVFSTAIIQRQVIACCCKPQTPKPVTVTTVAPPEGSEFSIPEGGGPGPNPPPKSVVLTFDKRLRPETVAANVVMTLQAGTFPPVDFPGTAFYDDANRTVTFTPPNGFGGDANGTTYTVRARGSGANPLRDVDNLALDGNRDGVGGDDFTSTFRVFFIIG